MIQALKELSLWLAENDIDTSDVKVAITCANPNVVDHMAHALAVDVAKTRLIPSADFKPYYDGKVSGVDFELKRGPCLCSK